MLPSLNHHHNNSLSPSSSSGKSNIHNNYNKRRENASITSFSPSLLNHYEREHKIMMIASLPIYTSFYEKNPCNRHYNNNKSNNINNTRKNRNDSSACTFGDRCMFSHSAICKHYKQVVATCESIGQPNCPFGKNCKYLHIDFKDTKAKRELKVLANSSQFSDTNRTDWFMRKENPLKKHNLKGFIDLVGINNSEQEEIENNDEYLSVVDMQINENAAFLALSDGTVWTCTNEALLGGIQGHREIGSTSSSMDYGKYLQMKEMNQVTMNTLERVPFSVKELNVVKCFSGGCLVTGTFSYYLTKDGSLLSQGCNCFGKLGKGSKDLSDSFVPFHIPAEFLNYQQAVDVALGQDHVMVLTSCGDVFSVGINEKGQCGVDPTLDRIEDFTLVKFPFESEQERIVKVASGDEHSLSLSNLGNVYGCGNNSFNQIDSDSEPFFGIFKKIAIQLAHQNDQIVDIICGPQYSVFLTKFGQVYMCGQNSFSQCCLPSRQTKVTSPTLISIRDEFIKKVICTKGSTTFFITRDNQIYAAGSNDYDLICPLTNNAHFNISKPVNVTNLILPENNGKWWQVEDIQSSPMFFIVHLIRIDHHAKKGMLDCALHHKFCDILIK